MNTMQELLRVCVHNFTCSSVVFAHDGKSILTAWNDGIIRLVSRDLKEGVVIKVGVVFYRSFTPLTGRLIYAILNAHNKGVSALATTTHGRILISGGCEGQVRLWQVSPYKQELICTLKVLCYYTRGCQIGINFPIFRNTKVQSQQYISTNLTRRR